MSTGPDDEALARAWQAGDEAAREALLRRYVEPLERYFCTKLGPERAEDLRQETLIRLLDALPRFRFESSVRTYVYRLAYRVLCDRLRYRASGRGRRDLAQCSLEQLEGPPALEFVDDARSEDLIRALRMLSAEDQVLIELRYVEGLSYAELAAATNARCANATLRARVHGIRKRLRALLGAEDETLRLTLPHPLKRVSSPPGLRPDEELRRLRAVLDAVIRRRRACRSWA